MASAYSVKDESVSVLKSTGLQRNEPLSLYPSSIVVVYTALLNFRHRLHENLGEYEIHLKPEVGLISLD